MTPWPMYHRPCASPFCHHYQRRLKQQTIRDALTNKTWISNIQGALTIGVIIDYLHLWDNLSDFFLQPEVEDRHIWRFSSDGQYSVKTAYRGLFVGSTSFEPWERVWKSWAPPKCRFFVWLVAHNRCWAVDRLRGLSHPK